MTPLTTGFTPTPRQAQAMGTYADEILFGGAAGGGKSEWIREEHLRLALMVPGSRSLILRRTFPQLRQTMIPALLTRIPRSLATYNKTEHTWTFTNGSVLVLGNLNTDEDVTNYQGGEYQLVSFDELTQFTAFQYTYLKSRLRMAGPVRQRMEALGWKPRMLAAANPGGIGHAWVKARFIDPAPAGRLFTVTDTHTTSSGTRCFIPSRVTDNPHVDPGYVQQLDALEPEQRRALRDGDWSSYTGQRFTSWRDDIHVITPEQAAELMPDVGGVRAVGVDYGMDAPFSAHWLWLGPDRLIIVYRELYRSGLTPAQQADLILGAERPGERGSGRSLPVAVDPSTWARSAHRPGVKTTQTGAPPPGSIAHAYYRRFGAAVVKANNDRLAGVALLADKLRVRADGMPRLLVVDTCRNLIRTLPALVRDVRNPEDVDTKGEDHAYDSLRYGLMEIDGRHRTRDHRPDRNPVSGHVVASRAPGPAF